MVKGMVLTILTIETISDLKTRSLSLVRIILYSVVAMGLNIVFYYQSIWSMLGGMLIGGMLLLYAFVTKEGIGYGDALIFIVLGALMGISRNIRLLFFSLIAAAVCGGVYALVRKKSIKTQIPFLPCVLGTYVVMCVTEVFL